MAASMPIQGHLFSSNSRGICRVFRQISVAAPWVFAGFFRTHIAVALETPFYSKDVAPIIFAHCAGCHRPGQAAPFSLLTYQEARKHATELARAVDSRYMPPWPPAAGYGEFSHSRNLADAQIALLKRWVEAGAPEGSSADLPPLPAWGEGWDLGKPDLVVELTQPYRLAADGPDVYRNFVLPVGIPTAKYVRAVEFRPGNPACVHHAFVKLARTPTARQLEGRDGPNGFGGLMLPAGVEMPEGHFLTWQPGKTATAEDPRMAWRLEPGNDLVLQLHLRPTGKVEWVQPSVALYFTDQVPDLTPFKFALSTLLIDLPAGAPAIVIRDQWELPASLRLLRVLPHAHYLGKDLQGFATLPDGSKRWLIRIRDWDFNWQGDYVYAQPIELPAGTVISLEYHYDNSTNNVRNPVHPPRRVSYGPGSTDEMAELWFQGLPLDTNSLPRLKQAYNQKIAKISRDYAGHRVAVDSQDVRARVEFATILMSEGKRQPARLMLNEALAIKPDDAEARYMSGVLFRLEDRLREARREFEKALHTDPNHGRAHGNLGIVLAALGELEAAERHLSEALRIDPEDSVAGSARDELRKMRAVRRDEGGK